ncbi:MAG: hypothetical protein WA294_19550 [Acidobacteriaceae bacterium]
MPSRPPLTTLLSQALVAFTIEFDNEAEQRMPHTTTDHGRTPGALVAPWLASMAMWFNCMQYVNEQGIPLRELHRLARTPTNLDGMRRWGYIFLEPDPADARRKPPQADWIVRARRGGRLIRQVWQPLFAEIEDRWRQRFGSPAMNELRRALTVLGVQLDPNLPDCMPIVGYGLFSSDPKAKDRRRKGSAHAVPSMAAASPAAHVSDLPLPALLARVLIAFAIEFEEESPVSLALSANLLPVLDEAPTRLRDLPAITGISTELVAVATGWLVRHGFAVLDTVPKPDRGKQIRLNEKGLLAQENSRKRIAAIEKRWLNRFGAEAIPQLREALDPLVKDGSADRSPLFAGLVPYPDGWRAKVRPPRLLPHFPMVTHRGGYPDGS